MRRRSFVAGSLSSLVLGALMGAIPRDAQAVGDESSERVAVLYFENQGNPELEPLKVGLAQMLITDLSGTPGVTVVERNQLQAILSELELGHSGKVSGDTAAKVGKLLGARWLILGSYFEMMGTLRIDARLVRVETGEIVASHGASGEAKAFMGLEKQLSGKLKGELTDSVAPAGTRSTPSASGQSTPAVVEQSAGEVIVPPDAKELQAAVAFSEGLIYLDQEDLPRAREAFESAVAQNPDLDEAKTALASLEL